MDDAERERRAHRTQICQIEADAVEFGCLKVVNPMSYLTIGSLKNISRLVNVSLNWTIDSTG